MDWDGLVGFLRVPSQREPIPMLLRCGAQSVSAWDHSPQRVGPKLGRARLVLGERERLRFWGGGGV